MHSLFTLLRTWRCRAILLALLLDASTCVVRSQEPAAPQLPDRKVWLAERTQELASYQFEIDGDQRRALTLEPAPLLDWSNPERQTLFGASFVWTYHGRPELIGSAYGRGRWLRHEFHSLSTQPLVTERDGEPVHRFPPGIEWRPLTDAPQPAASYPSRLTQMRRQAERFEVTMILRQQSEKQFPLRRLPQPAYRSPTSAADDVGLFLFVQGTDPECVLLLEVTAEKTWRYAFARQNAASLVAQLDGKQVFNLPGHQPEEEAYKVVTPPEAKALEQ